MHVVILEIMGLQATTFSLGVRYQTALKSGIPKGIGNSEYILGRVIEFLEMSSGDQRDYLLEHRNVLGRCRGSKRMTVRMPKAIEDQITEVGKQVGMKRATVVKLIALGEADV